MTQPLSWQGKVFPRMGADTTYYDLFGAKSYTHSTAESHNPLWCLPSKSLHSLKAHRAEAPQPKWFCSEPINHMRSR